MQVGKLDRLLQYTTSEQKKNLYFCVFYIFLCFVVSGRQFVRKILTLVLLQWTKTRSIRIRERWKSFSAVRSIFQFFQFSFTVTNQLCITVLSCLLTHWNVSYSGAKYFLTLTSHKQQFNNIRLNLQEPFTAIKIQSEICKKYFFIHF